MEQFDARRMAAGHPIHVVIAIDSLFEVQDSLFERLGHPGCCSGADIRCARIEHTWIERMFRVDPDAHASLVETVVIGRDCHAVRAVCEC